MGTEPDTAIAANRKSYTHGEAEKDVRCLQCSIYQITRCLESLK